MAKVNISQLEKTAMTKNENIVEAWEQVYNDIKAEIVRLTEGNTYLKALYAQFRHDFAPYLQHFTLDAVKREDWDNGIAENSIYLMFNIDLTESKIEIRRSGHVWISAQDKQAYQRDKYLAMHSMLDIAKRNGTKPMRKQGYKNAQDAAKKIVKAFNDIMEQVNDYTGGYPYKQGIKQLKTA